MSNILTTMIILQRQVHVTTNLCPCYRVTTKKIQHLYQCTHKGIRGRWTASVDALRKCIEAWNTDPYIAIILADTLLYTVGEINDSTQCPNLTLHSDIFHIGYSYITLGIITTSIARTQKTYFTHIGSRKNGIKMGQSTHHTNLETHLQTISPPQ